VDGLTPALWVGAAILVAGTAAVLSYPRRALQSDGAGEQDAAPADLQPTH
jgi:hypothetical protein